MAEIFFESELCEKKMAHEFAAQLAKSIDGLASSPQVAQLFQLIASKLSGELGNGVDRIVAVLDKERKENDRLEKLVQEQQRIIRQQSLSIQELRDACNGHESEMTKLRADNAASLQIQSTQKAEIDHKSKQLDSLKEYKSKFVEIDKQFQQLMKEHKQQKEQFGENWAHYIDRMHELQQQQRPSVVYHAFIPSRFVEVEVQSEADADTSPQYMGDWRRSNTDGRLKKRLLSYGARAM
jgi:myosin heavy subunit